MKKIKLSIVFILIFCELYAQNKNYFAEDLPFSTQDYKTEYITLLDAIYEKTSLRNEIKLFKNLYQLTKDKKDTLRLIYTSHRYARRLQYAGEHLKALPIFKEELELISKFKTTSKLLEENHLTKIEVLCQLGNCFLATNEIELSFEYYHNALELANKNNLSFYKAVIPSLIGSLKVATDDYDEALKYFNKSLNDLQFAEIDDKNIKFNSGLISINISQVYLKKKMLDSAQYIIEQAKKKGFFSDDYLTITGYEISKAEFLLEENKNREALDLLLKTKVVIDKEDPKLGILSYYNLLAKAYFQLGDVNSAIQTINLGLEVGESIYEDYNFTDDYKFLAELYKAQGNLEKSNSYLERYVLNQSTIDKSKKEIIDLFHEKEIDQLQQEKQSQQTFTKFLIAGGGLVILALLYFLQRLYKKRKKDEATFKKLHSKMKDFSTSNTILIDTKESEEDFEEKLTTDVPDETVEQILTGLKKLEEQNYFLKQECSSYNVAKKIKTNTSYLSKVINTEYQKNFNTYINDLRINYAIVRIENDKRFRSFSIQSIAEELGYKSADSFSKYFKIRTGLNPSFYIRKIKKST